MRDKSNDEFIEEVKEELKKLGERLKEITQELCNRGIELNPVEFSAWLAGKASGPETLLPKDLPPEARELIEGVSEQIENCVNFEAIMNDPKIASLLETLRNDYGIKLEEMHMQIGALLSKPKLKLSEQDEKWLKEIGIKWANE